MPFDDLDGFVAREHHPMALDDGRVAAVGVWRLARELRESRADRGLAQMQVAQQLGWSSVKVLRIETGQSKVPKTDVKALLNLYNVDAGSSEAHEMLEMANRYSSMRRSGKYKAILPSAHRRYLEFEAGATEVSIYASTLIPECLRTEAYGRSVADAIGTSCMCHACNAGTDVACANELRRERAAYLLGRNGPELRIILDESVFWRPIGGEDGPSGDSYSQVAEVLRGLQRVVAARGDTSAHNQWNPRVTLQIAPPLLQTLRASRIGFSLGIPLETLKLDEDVMAVCEGFDSDRRLFGSLLTLLREQASFDRLSNIIPGPEDTAPTLDALLAETIAR